MHAREEWLKETRGMVRHVDEGLPQTQYDYHFLGTEFSIVALRRGGLLDLHTETGYGAARSKEPVGRVSIRGWVAAVVDRSRRLSDLFHRLQPGLFKESLFQRDELTLQGLESWLIVHPL